MLAARFADGSLLLGIVALIGAEALLLLYLWYARGVGLAPRAWVGNLVSGALLMMAVRSALLDQPWILVAFWLLSALFAHLLDAFARWGARPAPAEPA
ncbi:MAG: hypothetical protein EBS39_03640 [Gammaproteobacteria bacterium]|nr:hypothetical protein [Gammaproteobacteria bacterium]